MMQSLELGGAGLHYLVCKGPHAGDGRVMAWTAYRLRSAQALPRRRAATNPSSPSPRPKVAQVDGSGTGTLIIQPV